MRLFENYLRILKSFIAFSFNFLRIILPPRLLCRINNNYSPPVGCKLRLGFDQFLALDMP